MSQYDIEYFTRIISLPYPYRLQERFNHRYLEFVRKYSNLIVGQYFGHQHSDSFRIFKDEKGKKNLENQFF